MKKELVDHPKHYGGDVKHETWKCLGRPDPVEQAAVLVEVCNGDLEQAQEFCVINIFFGNPREEEYWYRALQSLRNTGKA